MSDTAQQGLMSGRWSRRGTHNGDDCVEMSAYPSERKALGEERQRGNIKPLLFVVCSERTLHRQNPYRVIMLFVLILCGVKLHYKDDKKLVIA